MARTGVITLGEIAETLPLLNVQCDRCGWHGPYSTAKQVERFRRRRTRRFACFSSLAAAFSPTTPATGKSIARWR